MTFLLLFLSFFFQTPQIHSTEKNTGKDYPSLAMQEVQYVSDDLYIFNDTAIFQLNHVDHTLTQRFESEEENWIFATTKEGQLIGAKRQDSVFYIQNGTEDLTYVTLRDSVRSYKILDITYYENKLEFLATSVDFYLVTYDLGTAEIQAVNIGSYFAAFNGGGGNNNRIRQPFSNSVLNTQYYWTYDGDNRTTIKDSVRWYTIAFEEVTDLAYDVYGEVYGILDGTLYHFDLDSTLFVPYSLKYTGNLQGIFSHIDQPKQYGLAPKSQAFRKEAGQTYFGHVKITNRFDGDLEIQHIEARDNRVQIQVPDQAILATDEAVYLSFEVTSDTLTELNTRIKFLFESGGVIWSDSVFVEGVVYQPAVLSSADLLFYDRDEQHFVHKNSMVTPFSKDLDIASANARGLIYAISGNKMYRLDLATQYMEPIQELFATANFTVRGVYDMAFDGEDTYYSVSGSSDFRGGSSNRIEHYDLNGNRLRVISMDQFVSRIAYSKTRESLFLMVPEDGQYALYQHYAPEDYTFMRQQITPELNYVKDIFFDSQDELYMICSDNSINILSKIDLESGTHQVIDTLASGIGFGLSKLTDLPVNPDLDFEIEALLDSDLGSTSTVQVFPNPASEAFHINSNRQITKLMLMNLSGQSVDLKSIGEGPNTSWIPLNAKPGIYLLQVHLIGDKMEYHRLIIK